MGLTRRQFIASSAAMVATASALTMRQTFAADRKIELIAGPARINLAGEAAAASDLWTYNASSPGPQIRVRRGERVQVRLINNLPEPTSIHWHGIRIDNAMDGVSGLTQEAVAPGDVFDYDFVVPDAGTYWYHAHNKSWDQVARGLYGPLIVEEAAPVFDSVHDLVLVLDDWRLDNSGALDLKSLGSLMDWSHAGRLGNWLTVNGQDVPKFKLTAGEPYRIRLINACNARILAIDPARFDARIIAYDGQMLAAPEAPPEGQLLIAPAQRVDLLVVPQTKVDFALEERSGAPFVMAAFEVTEGSDQAPQNLHFITNDLPEPDLAAARLVRLDMTGGAMGRMGQMTYKGRVLSGQDFRDTGQLWAMNNVANLAEAPLFAARRGETIVLNVHNDTAFAHAMHTHSHHFRIIERQGVKIDGTSPWHDTFLIASGETAKIALVCDNPGKWLLHCHMLEHAAAGMNTWFEVL